MTSLATPIIPVASARVEIQVFDCRFIASVAPTTTLSQALAFIAEVRTEMPDATHHVYAYLIGHNIQTIQGMSDDGEPTGTAGRPVLVVLQNSGLRDITLVITRYFGGTLLGSGGLVRAYSNAARAVLEGLPYKEIQVVNTDGDVG